MEPLKPEIVELLRLVEEKYGKPLRTTTDYDEFSLKLERNHGYHISTSTLKRLWGYVGDRHLPRTNTLDKLTQYLGHPHFEAYCSWLKQSTRYNSSWFSTQRLEASTLWRGERIQIGWAPNRLLTLEYLGAGEFLVVRAEASKLQQDDRFSAPYIYKDFPLYLPWVERDGQRLPPFVAGRNGGITIINKESNQ